VTNHESRTGGLFAAGTALAIVAGTFLSVLKRFFRQAFAMESLGVIASIRRGWAVVIALSFLVLFPLPILFIALGVVAGALPACLVFLLSSLFFEGACRCYWRACSGCPSSSW
jgi:hypothetical protein